MTMKAFRDISIERKLRLAILAASFIPLVIAGALVFGYDVVSVRRSAVSDLRSKAALLAVSTRATLEFDDAKRAEETLRTFRAQPEVTVACLYEPDGTIFASYRRVNGAPSAFPKLSIGDADKAHWTGPYLELVHPVTSGQDTVGYVYLRSDSAMLYHALLQRGMILLGVLVVLVLVGYWLSSAFQRAISGPILALTSTAKNIAETRDYTARASKMGADELGTLTDSINEMLTAIQDKDRALQSAIEALRVENADRKHVQEELRATNERFQVVARATNDAVWDWNLATNELWWNESYQSLFGYVPEETDPGLNSWVDFIHPDDLERVAHDIHAVIDRGGHAWSDEYRFRRRDGTYAEIYDRGHVIHDADGKPVRMIGAMQDITERKRAEDLLAWEKGALELIASGASLSAAMEGLMLGLEKQAPGALCSVLLLDADGVHLRHGAAPSLPDAYNRAIDGAAIGPTVGSCGTAVYCDRQVIVSDIASDPLWADFRDLALPHGLRACWSSPIHGAEGKILGTFAIYYREPRHPMPAEQDLIARALHVTGIAIERKNAEAEIRELNTSLERRVRERTTQLEAAVKELDAFSYSVSHDLRAPLRAVDGFSRLVLKGYSAQVDADGQRMLGVIRSESQRMGQLIDDLLAFSRLGRQQMDKTAIDMHEMARAIFDELAASDTERKLRLDLRPLPAARGAESMIRQVWVNLISNAIKFTKEREVGEIEIGSREGGSGSHIYYVKDNGAGFDMRYVGKLFGVFQRLHSNEEFQGTGVGLALVQRIVQRHGCHAWAEGEVGQGATFSFELPGQP